MKTLYKCFALLLALGCCQISLAENSELSPLSASATVTITGAVSSSTVCANDPFTATANVYNTSLTGLTYEWSISIGTVNGQLLTTTTTKSITGTVTRPFVGTRADIKLKVMRGSEMLVDVIKPITVLPEVTPPLPGNITVNAPPPSPNGAVCQFSSVTFSVPSVPGASSYVWTATGISSTSSSRSFTVSFGSSGNKTISVRAIGCAGSSPVRTTNVSVIPSNQAPCNESFAVAAPVATFPNPATTTFALAVPESYVTATAQLTSQETGKAVKTFTVTGTTTQVATNDLPSGVYLLTVPGKEGKITKRIIVQ